MSGPTQESVREVLRRWQREIITMQLQELNKSDYDLTKCEADQLPRRRSAELPNPCSEIFMDPKR
jgi:hypothetical protein